jgi:hypothetical protein
LRELTKTCTGCGGTGSNPGFIQEPGGPVPAETTCLKCEGIGSLPDSKLSPDLIDFLNDMSSAVDDIKQKVDEIKTVVDAL